MHSQSGPTRHVASITRSLGHSPAAWLMVAVLGLIGLLPAVHALSHDHSAGDCCATADAAQTHTNIDAAVCHAVAAADVSHCTGPGACDHPGIAGGHEAATAEHGPTPAGESLATPEDHCSVCFTLGLLKKASLRAPPRTTVTSALAIEPALLFSQCPRPLADAAPRSSRAPPRA